jgi:hypothetical protein
MRQRQRQSVQTTRQTNRNAITDSNRNNLQAPPTRGRGRGRRPLVRPTVSNTPRTNQRGRRGLARGRGVRYF